VGSEAYNILRLLYLKFVSDLGKDTKSSITRSLEDTITMGDIKNAVENYLIQRNSVNVASIVQESNGI